MINDTRNILESMRSISPVANLDGWSIYQTEEAPKLVLILKYTITSQRNTIIMMMIAEEMKLIRRFFDAKSKIDENP
jgi:hypothetical protein